MTTGREAAVTPPGLPRRAELPLHDAEYVI